MRFNDKEITQFSISVKSDLEGILSHMKPPQGIEWYQQSCFKERYFKLKANLLFYNRIGEFEPLGVLILENAQIAYERPHKGIPFAFSLTFKVNDKFRDNNEAKHIFSCRCEADVNRWVDALKIASYEHWRSQCTILRTKLAMKTGKDPILEYLKNNKSSTSTGSAAAGNIIEVKKIKFKENNKSTFYSSNAESTSFYTTTTTSSNGIISSESSNEITTTVENFITF